MLSAQSQGGGSAPGDFLFHTTSQVVLVDAVVTDKNGNVPRDLTARDFRILEDGKEQQITSVSLETMGGEGRSRRFVALLFEQDASGLRDAARRFVDEFAGPNVYIAVYARVGEQIHLQQGFTTDVERLKAALADMRVTAYDDKEVWQHDTHLAQISELAATLAPIRGRKALVDLGWNRALTVDVPPEGRVVAPPPVVAQLGETVDACNQANVSLYSFELIEGRHLSAGDVNDRSRRADATLNVTQNLAVRTGGRYTQLPFESLSSFLGSLVSEQADYYLLGYTPIDHSADQPCHKLKITVSRRGLDVNARENYCRSDDWKSRNIQSLNALRIRLASGTPGSVKLGLQMPWFFGESHKPLIEIAMEIDPSAMNLTGKLRGELEVSGAAYREDGSIAARFGDTEKLQFKTQEELNAFRNSSFHYSTEFSVPAGRYDVRIAVGAADGAFGSISKTLNIDPWNGQTFELSALALSDDDRPLPALTAALNSEMIIGPHRLGSRGRETMPMGGMEFHANGMGFFYFEVYNPQNPVTPPHMRIRVLDRTTGGEKEDSGPLEVGDSSELGHQVIPIALTLPIASLGPGIYTLEVRVAHDDEKDAIVRTADFNVK